MSDETPGQPVPRGAPVRAAGGASPRTPTSRRTPTTRPRRTGSRSGRSRPSGSTGTRSGTRSSTGTTRRSRSGSSAASSTRRTTASTGTSRTAHGDKVAFHWVGEPEDDTRDITYADLKDEVCKAANALIELGVETGDRVAIYMPMIPETVDRDAGLRPHRRPAHRGLRRLLLRRAGQPASTTATPRSSSPPTAATGAARPSALKPAVDEALRASAAGTRSARCSSSAAPGRTSSGTTTATCGGTTSSTRQSTEHECRVLRRRAPALRHVHLRHDRQAQGHPAHHRRLPRRLRRTRTGAIFDLKPETDVYWCTADVGWVTGHSYIVYGPLANGATSVMYEGTPDTPHKGRWWEIIEKYGVTIFYTAPDGDPDVHEVGRRHPREARPVLAAAARLGR